MNTFARRMLTGLPLAAALFAAPAIAQTETEPNNTLAQASGPFSPGVTVQGVLANGDMDFYRITLTEQLDLSLAVWGPTVGVCPFPFDPVLTVFDASGAQIAGQDDPPGSASLCSQMNPSNSPGISNLAPGTYYVKVHPLGAFGDQAYTLVISGRTTPRPLAENFTYQGVLESGGAAFTGSKQMMFSLWSDPQSMLAGNRLSLPILYQIVDVVNGTFTVDLDFTIPQAPPNYDGTERYLEIEIADVGGGNPVVLNPRQRLAPTPHAIRAIRAATADNATTATEATHAATASSASYADQAAFASSASNVLWLDVTNKPTGFADNVDNEGGWTVTPGTSYTTANVGINTSNTSGFDFAVSGTAAKTGGGSWATFCDERLKHDIAPLTGTLDRLLQLRGYTYEYNADAVERRLALPGTQIGLMAQEVERVFPDWVEKDGEGYRYVTERATTALMVEALRDLRTEKDRQLEAVKAENADLKTRLERLERLMTAKP